MIKRTSILLVFMIFVSLAFISCEGNNKSDSTKGEHSAAQSSEENGAKSAPAKQRIDAFKLLSLEEATALVGKEVGKPKVYGDGIAMSSCNYFTEEKSGVGLMVRAYDEAEETLRVFEEARAEVKDLAKVDPVAVEGVGETAFWIGGTMNQLNIVKGRYWVSVTIFKIEDQPVELAKAAAEKVLPKLN